ncbi:MAG: hypothetical protein EPO21_18445 [Chloroflexota bacterium]|nr:MAG: hypothetical protein EPO21_18445 [Chloroflexota bacterium]
MLLPFLSSKSARLTLGTYGPPLLNLPLALGQDGIATHKHVIGTTGQGKSKLLASLFLQLLHQNIGCALIDPHADLARDVLSSLVATGYFDNEAAFERLLFVDFSRQDRLLPFNVLAVPYEGHQVANQINEVCKRAWPALSDGAAPQFENILLASVLVLIENSLPITSMPKLLTVKSFRDGLLSRVSDPQVVSFFHDRFDRWGREAPTMIESTLRRVFLLTFSPTLRYTLGQKANALDFRKLMDQGISVLFNLGGLDEDTQRFLGCLITVGYEVAALSRADLPEDERRQYHLIMDEFSMFSAQSEESLSRVLSLARKYGLYLTLAHQTWSQLSSHLKGALQNAIEICFKVGPDDAAWAAPRFARYDPYLIKHNVVDPYQVERTHPLYFTVQEILHGWAQALTDLKPRQAFVKVGQKTSRIRTRTFPTPRCTMTQLSAVKEQYAQLLLTPKKTAIAEVEPEAIQKPASVRRTVSVHEEDAQ